MTVKLCATLEMMIPTMKLTVQNVSTGMRPKMWDRAPIGAWKMAELSRKLVPVQKASVAVPCRSAAMIYRPRVSNKCWGGGTGKESSGRTGNATDTDVPSNETIRARTASDEKAR